MNLHITRIHITALLVVFLLAIGVTTVAAVPGDYTAIYTSTNRAGTTEDGLAYQPGDIIANDGPGQPWYMYFEAAAHGVAGANITALDIAGSDPYAVDAPTYMVFSQPRVRLPDGAGMAYAQDVVKYTPSNINPSGTLELIFDGSDVGLTLRTERIDSLTVFDPQLTTAIDVPADCAAGVLFLSTAGNYRVRAADGTSMAGRGGDILAFCATNLGPDTAGFWFRAFDATAAGLWPLQAIRDITVHDYAYDSGTGEWGLYFSFFSNTNFRLGAFNGFANNVYLMDTTDLNPVLQVDLNTDYPTLNSKADGLEIAPVFIVCGNVC